MPSRVSIYNPQGRKLTELEVDFYREWKISEYGAGKFDISVLDPMFTKDNVDYGNWVYVEHDRLPAWIGTIETPRDWNNGMVTVNCKSGEARLQRALTRPAQKWEGAPGVIFEGIINDAGGGVIGLTVGDIFTGGDSITFSEPYLSIYECAEKLAKYHEHEWNVEPLIDPTGALKFACNWANKLGTKRREIKLYEDKHITKLTEQGDMTNSCFAHGSGSNFTNPDLTGEYVDYGSVADYGLAELLVCDGATNRLNNQRMAQTYVEEHMNPRRTFTIALEDSGSLFSVVHIGDRFPVETYTIGFTGNYIGMKTELRILQMNYKDSEGVLNVVADEVTDG